MEARPITVLVADDSAALRALVRITLTSEGWSVIEADTAEAAREMARSVRPDLVILDISFGLTGPDGLAICAELKADPATAAIPIVMLTGHVHTAERERAAEARADAFVGKPFGPIELMDVLRALLPATPAIAPLGAYLMDAGVVEPTALEAALVEQRALVTEGTPKRLGDVLVAQGSVSGHALDRALLEQMHARATHADHPTARVLIIDDHAAVREGLKSLIAEDEALEFVGEAVNAEHGLRLARRHQPDVIVIDNEMPGGSGIDILPALRAGVPGAKLVMFSLDSAARTRALAAGAHAFVVKDAPIAHILQALQPARAPGALQPSANAVVPPYRTARHLRRAGLVLAAALGGYVALFFALHPAIGASAGAFSVLPVVVAGALLGPEGGLAAGVLAGVISLALWSVTGHAMGDPVLQIGGGFGIVVLLILGLGAGSMRLLGLRFDPRARRVEAIAAAAQALAGLDRGGLVDVFLDAMLRVVPGDTAFLFSNAAGDARLVASSRDVSDASPDGFVQLARDVMRAATPRTIDELAPAERPWPAMRSAVIVPVSVAGQEVRGAIVVAHREPRRFTAADIVLIRPFAEHLWVILRRGPLTPSGAATKRART